MRNLAGVSECDKFIKLELERSKIPIETALAHRSEVPYTLMGRLGSIAFKRAWTYWVTEGLVPMAVAEELYADPVGVTDIRVAGHAAAPAPEEWAEWIMPDGHQVWPASEEAASLDFRNRHPEWKIPEDLFSDNPAELGATRGITTYHIDTEVGLRVFADTLRAHSLTSNSVTQ